MCIAQKGGVGEEDSILFLLEIRSPRASKLGQNPRISIIQGYPYHEPTEFDYLSLLDSYKVVFSSWQSRSNLK